MGLQVATTSSSPSTSLTCTVSSKVAQHHENIKCKTPFSKKNLLTSSAINSKATKICANGSNHQEDLETAENPEILSSPNVSSPDVMAPALTEPLSPTNKLTSSATSASPRPISSSNSYSLNNLSNHYGDINGNNGITGDIESSTITNNNANFLPAKKAGQLIISTTSGTIGTSSTTTSNTVNGTGAFQLAFEQVVAAKAAKHRRSGLPNGTSTSNGKVPPLLERFEPMCDKNTNSLLIDSISQEQQVEQTDNNGDQNFVVTQVIFADQRMDLDENADFVGEQQQQQQQNGEEQEQMEHQSQPDESTQELFVVETIVDQDKTESDFVNMEECEVPNESIGGDDSQNTAIIAEQCDDINSQGSTQTTLTDQSAPVAVASDGTNIAEDQQQSQQQQEQQTQDSQTQVQQNIDASTTGENMPPNIGLNKDFIKESAEMEQVLGELTSTEMDILQVLKGFDTTPGGDAALCDLAGGLGLFNDVDCMNYEEVGIPAKDPPTREIRNEIEKQQQQMQRKCDFLLRRLKKMQSRFMAKHTSEEIAGLFEWTNRLVRRKDTDRVLSYDDDKYRPVSMASMKAFLKRIDAAATAQHLSVKRNKIVKSTSDSPDSSNVSSSSPNATVVNVSQQDNKTPNVQTSFIPQLDEKSVAEIEHVSGMLQTELKEVQIALDSDVTASSSGGESADEMVTYNNQVQQPLSIAKRAGWRWARDRAEVASRWTWLLTQISDLEYRIRQHTELHNQIKKHKGVVICGQPAPNSNVSETTIPSSVNGYRGVLPGNTKALDTDTVSPNGAYDTSGNLSGSCRTRPFQRSGFRKRRLLQTAHLHTVTKRAARSSTIKCGCQWPLHPCALCTGRPDPTAPRDLPDTMPLSERVALLDPGFHPVLSFPEDINSSVYLEGVMRSPDWQNRMMRCSTKTALKGALAAQKAAEREDRSKKITDSRRKYNRKFSQDMAANKLKNAKNRRALHGTQFTHLIKNKHRKNSSSNAGASGNTTGINSGQQGAGFSSTIPTPGSDSTLTGLHFADNNDLNSAAQNGLLPRSKNASPTPPGYSSNSIYKNERMDRRSRNSYDIDNIVIPYSVAASTRVEILPYKEIPTPKWRVIDDDDPVENKPDELLSRKSSVSNSESEINLPPPSATTMTTTTSVQEQNEESEVEDISNEAIQSRHEKALLEERRKFQTYLKFPWSTRSRANRRVDSRTESSGANTPDPTSPAPNTPSVIGGDQESIPSPIAPSTPLTPLENADVVDPASAALGTTATTASTNNNQSLSIMQLNSQLNSTRKERKRTVSSKRERDKDETRRSHSPDTRETIPPFEPLPFPLSDEMYEVMLHVMPNDHHILEDCIIKNVNNCDKTTDTKNNSTTTTSYVINNHHIINNSNTNATIVSQTINRNMNSIIYNTTSTFDESETLMDGDSDTDSAESGLPDEDPNDPEWREPA